MFFLHQSLGLSLDDSILYILNRITNIFCFSLKGGFKLTKPKLPPIACVLSIYLSRFFNFLLLDWFCGQLWLLPNLVSLVYINLLFIGHICLNGIKNDPPPCMILTLGAWAFKNICMYPWTCANKSSMLQFMFCRRNVDSVYTIHCIWASENMPLLCRFQSSYWSQQKHNSFYIEFSCIGFNLKIRGLREQWIFQKHLLTIFHRQYVKQNMKVLLKSKQWKN